MAWAAVQEPQAALEHVPGELIVKLKPGATLADVEPLNQQFGVTATKPVFPNAPDPQERLAGLKHALATLAPAHRRWHWFRKDSQEATDYAARVAAERNALEAQIQAQEALITRFEARQAQSPKGTGVPRLDAIHLLTVPEATDLSAMARAYEAHPHVEYAEPNDILTIPPILPVPVPNPDPPPVSSTAPNDPYYKELWGHQQLHAEEGWAISQGAGVIVAVVDTGADFTHPDLAANLVPGFDFVNSVDANGDGDYTDPGDIRDTDPTDDHGHGTHVAGTIAAVGNNGQGIIGVAPQAKIMPLKGLNARGNGDVVKLARALRHAALSGAAIINNSWGLTGRAPPSQTLEDVVREAHALGSLVVFAAGNSDDDIAYYSPANIPEAVAVTALDAAGRKARFSNWGTAADVAAPGVAILSLQAAGTLMGTPRAPGYTIASGTSMAAPHAAGVAALIKAHHPDWNVAQLMGQLINAGDAVDDANPDFAGRLGLSRLNAYQALTASPSVSVVLARCRTVSRDNITDNDQIDPGETVDLILSLHNTWAPAAGVTATLEMPDPNEPITIQRASAAFGALAAGELANGEATPLTITFTHEAARGRDYALSLTLVAEGGFQRAAPLAIHLPEFEAQLWDWTLDDPNQNETLEPGETATVRVRVENTSPLLDLPEAVVTLTILDPYVTVRTPSVTLNKLPRGTISDPLPFEIIVSPHAPKGHTFTGALQLTADRWVHAMASIPLEVPLIVPHPGWPKHFDGSECIASPTVADVDHDGMQEIVAVTRVIDDRVGRGPQSSYTVHVWDHRGAPFHLSGRRPAPQWPKTLPPGVLLDSAPALADLNGDGMMEIIAVANDRVTTGHSVCHVWRADGTTFSPTWPRILERTHRVLDGVGFAPVVGDVDGDGHPEIVVCLDVYRPPRREAGPVLYVLKTDGSLLDPQRWPLDFGRADRRVFTAGAPSLADLDGDGAMEIIQVVSDQGMIVHAVNAVAASMPGWPVELGGLFASLPSANGGDFNHDGTPELAVGTFGAIHLFTAGGMPFNQAWPKQSSDLGGGRFGEIYGGGAVSADLDRDGRMELLTRVSGGYLFALRHDSGSVVPGWPQTTTPGFATGDPVVADITGDGDAEIVITGGADFNAIKPSGRYDVPVYAFHADGKPVQGWPRVLSRSFGPTVELLESLAPAIADLDADGDAEIIAVTNSMITVWDQPGRYQSHEDDWPMYRHDAQHTGWMRPAPAAPPPPGPWPTVSVHVPEVTEEKATMRIRWECRWDRPFQKPLPTAIWVVEPDSKIVLISDLLISNALTTQVGESSFLWKVPGGLVGDYRIYMIVTLQGEDFPALSYPLGARSAPFTIRRLLPLPPPVPPSDHGRSNR